MKHYSVNIGSYFLGLLTAFAMVFIYLLREDKKITERRNEQIKMRRQYNDVNRFK